MYIKNGLETVKGRMLKTVVLSLVCGVPIMVIIFAILNSSGFCILVYLVAFMDLMILLDNALLRKTVKNSKGEVTKKSVHFGAIMVVTVCVVLVMLAIATGACLFPGPLYDAIIAYDEGTSTDLTLPITFWLICLVADIILTTLISIVVNKKLNKE